MRWPILQNVGDLSEISRRFFHGDDVLDLRQRERGLGLDVPAGAAGHVVHDDRQVRRAGDPLEVLDDAPLWRLVVHRRDVQQVRRTGGFHLLRHRDRFLRVVRAGAGDYGHASLRLLDRDLDDTTVLGRRHRRGFAGRSAGDQKVDSLLDLPVDKFAERRLVECAVLCERRYERRAAAFESLSHSRPPIRQPS